MIAGLPRLFNAVRLIFQSANRTVFTCKDLTRMVVSAHPDIIDQGRVSICLYSTHFVCRPIYIAPFYMIYIYLGRQMDLVSVS